MPNSEKIHKLPDAEQRPGALKRLQAVYRRRPEPVKWTIYLMVSAALMLLIFYPRPYPSGVKYKEGGVALKTIKVWRDEDVVDQVTTDQRKNEAASAVRDIYDYDPSTPENVNLTLADFFAKMHELYQGPAGREEVTMPPGFKEETREELLGVGLTQSDIDLLSKFYFDPEILSRMQRIVRAVYGQPVAADLAGIKLKGLEGIIVKDLQHGETSLLTDYDQFQDLAQVREKTSRLVRQRFAGYPLSLKNLLGKILDQLLRPSLVFNEEDTERAKDEVRSSVPPEYFKFRRGEIIVHRGEIISAQQLKMLQAYQGLRSPFTGGFLFFGLLIALTLSQFFIYNFAERNVKKFRAGFVDLVFLSTLLLLSLAAIKLFEYLGFSIKDSLGLPDGINFYYLAGAAGTAMLVRMVLNSETAAIYTLLLAGFSGLVTGFDYYTVLYQMVGGLVAASEVGTAEQRTKIFRAGLYLGIVNIVMVMAFAMMQGNIGNHAQLTYNIIFAVTGGILISIVVAGVNPVVESVFGYATNIKLLELLNQEHPLLKEFSLKASGSHQHSLSVANLAEAASEAIGANPLLARVVAMYHDVGKMDMPNYFAENQWDQKNPHTRIKPTMSALILIKHAKEGVGLTEKHRLPRQVIDAIQQHHGTSLIKFFYEKAKELERPGVETVDEQEFRYPGPKPQTREAGILMLADIVESAARSLREPNPAKLQGMVQNLVNRVFVDGQLDECELTLKDLHEISKAFVKVLGAMYHSRPEYPQPVEKGVQVARKNGDTGPEPPETKAAKEPAQAQDTEVIKRLGS